jgi:hypothetical protein
MIRFIKIAVLLIFISIQSIGLVGSVMAADKISDLPTYNASSFELIPEASK